MNMSGDIRVRTDVHYKGIYSDFKNFIVKDMHEIFFLCACLGFREGKRKPLGRDGDDRFFSYTFTPEEYANFYAMAIATDGMNFLAIEDDKKVIAEMEEYANAGMEILTRDLLADYLVEKDGCLSLVPGCSELPKVIMAYIFDKAND